MTTNKTMPTPGPWTIQHHGRSEGCNHQAAAIEGTPMQERPIAQWVYKEADARLIAAAPEMAEILKRILANPAWLAISDVYDGLALLKKAGVI